MRTRTLIGLAICLLATLSASAASFDGSKPLTCVALDAVECDHSRNCSQGPAWEVNLPLFLEVDFAKKSVVSVDELSQPRTSEVLATKKLDGMLTMMGAEGAYAWSLAIAEETGMMSLTLAGQEHGFIVIGACNPK